ncbi:MAG: hypothetical protein IK100_01050 [Muribaculaceae bacterium]|nr:hypothetical protein [Muribaculaceae bacterium]
MKASATYIFLIAAMLLVVSCKPERKAIDNPKPAVYYWRTTFSLDDVERQFLRDYKVEKMYVRYFDVVVNEKGLLRPNAGIKFIDSVPDGIEVIPTVFIVNNCVNQGIDTIAPLLVNRVLQMCETHDIKGVKELQIDCDWTIKTQDAYFKFLEKVRQLLAEKGMKLSATIRLHQLAMEAPPVDYGVLMMYNTGDLKNSKQRNPILDKRDVEPYLRYLAGYSLPLCAAYPNFGWQLLYTGDKFRDILYSEDLNDTTLYKNVGDGKYLVRSSIDLPNYLSSNSSYTYLNAGDTVMVVKPDAETLVQVHDALSHERPGINDQVIIYHLNNSSINNYSQSDYEKIFNP